eukprot:CFRG6493T1
MTSSTKQPPQRPSTRGFDVETFRRDGHALIDYIADYMDVLNKKQVNENFKEVLKVVPDVKPGFLELNEDAMEEGSDFASTLTEFHTKVLPGVLHWQDPFFMSYYPCQMSFPAFLGDMLSNAVNSPNFSWLCNPAASEMEVIVMDTLCDAFGLPRERYGWRKKGEQGLKGNGGGGVIQHSATDAMIVSAVAARSRSLHNDPSSETRLVAYASQYAHFCAQKGVAVAGINHMRMINCIWDEETQNWPMDVEHLEATIKEDIANGLVPSFVSASVGATGTCSIDPISRVADIAEKYEIWFTVDAAYAGVAAILPEVRPMFKGWERADSIIMNASKWFGCLFNSSLMFMANAKSVSACLDHSAVYIASGAHDKSDKEAKVAEKESRIADARTVDPVDDDKYHPVDFKDLQLSLGKNWRSLKIWTMLRTMGLKDLRDMMRRHMSLGKYIATRLTDSGYFEIMTKTEFGLVCLRPRNETDERVLAFLSEAINKSRETFMVHTVMESRAVIRLVIAHPDFSEADADWIVDKLVLEARKFGVEKHE